MKIADLFFKAIKELEEVGIRNPELEATLILCEVLTRLTKREWTQASLLANLETPLRKKALTLFQKMLSKRKARIPLAYILGHWQFFGYKFFISPTTLTPRPESEKIVEKLRFSCKKEPKLKF
jgi:release factor glutamine methyltransferase